MTGARFRLTLGAAALCGMVGMPLVAGVAPALATTSYPLHITTASTFRPVPTNITRFREVGGAVLRLPGQELQGRLTAVDRTDLSQLQCLVTEKRDTITLQFSRTDSLMLLARGSDVAPPACAGFRFHRVLSFVITGGTGAFTGARGNGTATGTLRSTPNIDFATILMTWTGVLTL